MGPRLLLVLAILCAVSCSRRGFGYSSGSGSRGFKHGSISYSKHRHGQEAGAGQTMIELHPDLKLDDFEFSLYVFQDLNGDGVYSAQVDRMLAEDDGLHKIDDRKGFIKAVSFNFRAAHEPIGLHWTCKDPDGFIHSMHNEML